VADTRDGEATAPGNRSVTADGGNRSATKIAAIRNNEKKVQVFDSPD
jgi:ABC-type xylose transport system permease subunit